jgi:hypothetical protein
VRILAKKHQGKGLQVVITERLDLMKIQARAQKAAGITKKIKHSFSSQLTRFRQFVRFTTVMRNRQGIRLVKSIRQMMERAVQITESMFSSSNNTGHV